MNFRHSLGSHLQDNSSCVYKYSKITKNETKTLQVLNSFIRDNLTYPWMIEICPVPPIYMFKPNPNLITLGDRAGSRWSAHQNGAFRRDVSIKKTPKIFLSVTGRHRKSCQSKEDPHQNAVKFSSWSSTPPVRTEKGGCYSAACVDQASRSLTGLLEGGRGQSLHTVQHGACNVKVLNTC